MTNVGMMGSRKDGTEAVNTEGKVAKMSDLIDRQVAIDAVKKNTFRLTFAEEQNCEGHVAWSAEAVYSDVMEGALLELPSAQPEYMHTVMLKIKEKYEKAMNTPCISNPMAWALYQTWKEYDR